MKRGKVNNKNEIVGANIIATNDVETFDSGSGDAPAETVEDIYYELPVIDFTPSNFITLLFTDIGVLTPAAVSDELIRLYQ